MFELLIILTGVVIFWTMWKAYASSRDPLHPLMYLGPLLFYAYVFKPGLLFSTGWLLTHFTRSDLQYVQLINLVGVAAFCVGCLNNATPPGFHAADSLGLSDAVRHRMLIIAWVLGLMAVAAFAMMVNEAGGLVRAYGHAKGGGRSTSGYVSEAQMLAFPAIVLLFLAWRGQRLTLPRLAAVFLFASPHLIHGILGARRGPTFLVLSVLCLSYYVVSSKRPKLTTVFAGVFVVGGIILALVVNRQSIYIGSDFEDEEPVRETGTMLDNQVREGEDWTFGAGTILTSQHFDFHFWGKRYLTVLFVRPIPKQIWPTKYEDVGMGWMTDQADVAGLTDTQWISAVGWRPQRGSAPGFIADLFLEMWYGYAFICFFFGYFYSLLWRKAVMINGLWGILYVFAAILSIYVPTQSLSAWGHRFVLMTVPTALIWHYLITPLVGSNRLRGLSGKPAIRTRASLASRTAVAAGRKRIALLRRPNPKW